MLQLLQNNFDFFPLNRALSLENEDDTNEQRMEHMQKQIDYLVDKMKEQVTLFLLLSYTVKSFNFVGMKFHVLMTLDLGHLNSWILN